MPGLSRSGRSYWGWPRCALSSWCSDSLTSLVGSIWRWVFGWHSHVDLATEPRWSRVGATFGEDAGLTSELAVSYVRGFQGKEVGPTSVSTMTTHFPGGGPQLDGEDPHFVYG
jgi:hypothetical protein